MKMFHFPLLLNLALCLPGVWEWPAPAGLLTASSHPPTVELLRQNALPGPLVTGSLKNVLHKAAALTHPSRPPLSACSVAASLCLSPSSAWAPRSPGPRGKGLRAPGGARLLVDPAGPQSSELGAQPLLLRAPAACLWTAVPAWAQAPRFGLDWLFGPHFTKQGPLATQFASLGSSLLVCNLGVMLVSAS